MTRSVTPRPTEVALVVCDECGDRIAQVGDDELPGDWRAFALIGWVGSFHACCDDHETRVRSRYERPEGEA